MVIMRPPVEEKASYYMSIIVLVMRLTKMMTKEDDEHNDEMMIYTLLPRYLPVTRQEGFDLRGHIESAGHQVNFLIDCGLSMHTEDKRTKKKNNI